MNVIRTKGWLINFFFLFLIGLSLRLYNFPQRVNFGPEQGVTLSTTYEYIHGKFSLLGLPNPQRFTTNGLQIFSGSLYNYALIPAMFALGKNPIALTYFALTINILTALLMYYLILKLNGHKIAFFSTFFFLFNATMIDQSLTVWIINPMPLVGLLSMYLLIKYFYCQTTASVIFLGVLSGIGINLEYLYLPTALAIAIFVFFRSRKKIKNLFLFFAGMALPLAPIIIFDFRHDWYHVYTLWQYLLDTLKNPNQSKIQLYHFWQFYPPFFYFLGLITNKLMKIIPMLGYLLIIVYAIYNFTSPLFSLTTATGMEDGLNTPQLMGVAKKIASEAGPRYNIVYMPKAEYRAYALRYLLYYFYFKPPMGIEDYPYADEIYVVASNNQSLDINIPWEISSFQPSFVAKEWPIQNEISLYLLEKEK